MKSASSILVTLLMIVSGCGGGRQSVNETDVLVTVDVTASYQKKELILQDFMDVEYVALETEEGFHNQGFVLDVGRNMIVVKNNPEVPDGDIFIFDRKGKGIRKINHRGPGAEEYRFAYWATLDEEAGELFVNDIVTRAIVVYDLDGNFKRRFKHAEGTMYDQIVNCGRDHLICSDGNFNYDGVPNRTVFSVISKHDGSVVRNISLPFEEPKSPVMTVKNDEGQMIMSGSPFYIPIIPLRDIWVLSVTSSDTVYSLSQDYIPKPLFARTPSIQTMPQEIYLFPGVLTDRYHFMASVKKEYDFNTRKGYPATPLVYDSREGEIYEYTVYNGDYTGKQVNMLKQVFNHETVFCVTLEAVDLVEAYEKGHLQGRLKEIAATLDEEDNPVIMLVKYKK